MRPWQHALGGMQSWELTPAPAPSHSSRRTMPPDENDDADRAYSVDPRLHRRTLRKLDCLLLPFLALLFLFNALDKANVSCIEPDRSTSPLTMRRDR
jgi:hypothetical protein